MGEENPEGVPQPTEEEIKLLENEEPVFSEDEEAELGEETSKKVKSLGAQKKHWRGKHTKLNEDFEKYKKDNPVKEPETKPKVEEKKEKKSSKDDVIADLQAQNQQILLKQDNPDLTTDQIKKAVAYAKAEGVETQEFIQSDHFKAIIKVDSDKLAAKKSGPDPSNRNGSSPPDFAKATPEDIKGMNDETYKEFQAYMIKEEGGDSSGITIKRKVTL